MKTLGKKIKELRAKYKITQMDLADALAISFETVKKWEGNKKTPSDEMMEGLSWYFGIAIGYFYNDGVEEVTKPFLLTKEQRENSFYGILVRLRRLEDNIILDRNLDPNHPYRMAGSNGEYFFTEKDKSIKQIVSEIDEVNKIFEENVLFPINNGEDLWMELKEQGKLEEANQSFHPKRILD